MMHNGFMSSTRKALSVQRMMNSLRCLCTARVSNPLWQRATAVIVGWFAVRSCTDRTRWCT